MIHGIKRKTFFEGIKAMKSALVEKIADTSEIISADMYNSLCTAYENILTCGGQRIMFDEPVKEIICEKEVVYVFGGRYIYTVENMKIKEKIEIHDNSGNGDNDNINSDNNKDNNNNEKIKKIYSIDSIAYIVYDFKVCIYKIGTGVVNQGYISIGNKILDAYVKKDNEEIRLVLLIGSEISKFIRVIGIKDDDLEEITQISVSKSAYKVFAADNGIYATVGSNCIEYITAKERKKIAFGSGRVSGVRDGVVIGDKVYMCMLGDEVCLLDLHKKRISAYYKIDMVAERMKRVKDKLLIYNREGDVCMMDVDGRAEWLRKGNGRLVSMKVVREREREILYTLRHTRDGSVISCIDKVIGVSEQYSISVEKEPLSLCREENILLARYPESTVIYIDEKEAYRVGKSVCASINKGTGIAILDTGIICKWKYIENRKDILYEQECLYCGKKEKEHSCKKKVFFGCIKDSVYAFADERSIYVLKDKEIIYTVDGIALSLEIDGYICVVNMLDRVVSVNLKDKTFKNLHISGRWIYPVDDNKYLVNGYDGSLHIMEENERREEIRIRIGANAVIGASRYENRIVLNTLDRSILIKRNQNSFNAFYVEKCKNKSAFALNHDGTCIFYLKKESKVVLGRVDAEEKLVQKDRLFKTDIELFCVLGKYLVAVSAFNSQENKKKWDTTVALYRKKTMKFSIVYKDSYVVECLNINGCAVIGCNSANQGNSGSLYLLTSKNSVLIQRDHITISESVIISLFVQNNMVYCETSTGMLVYRIKKGIFKKVKTNNTNLEMLPNEKMLKIENNTMVTKIESAIRFQSISSKEKKQVYINVMYKDYSLQVIVLDENVYGIGHNMWNSVSHLNIFRFNDSKGFELDQIGYIYPRAEITQILSGSMSLVNRCSSAYISLASGSIYRFVYIPQGILDMCMPSDINISRAPSNLFLFFGNTWVVYPNSNMHNKEEVEKYMQLLSPKMKEIEGKIRAYIL